MEPSALIRISNWTNSRWQRCTCQIRSCPGRVREKEQRERRRRRRRHTALSQTPLLVAEWVPYLSLSPSFVLSFLSFPLFMPNNPHPPPPPSPNPWLRLSLPQCQRFLNNKWQLKHPHHLQAYWERGLPRSLVSVTEVGSLWYQRGGKWDWWREYREREMRNENQWMEGIYDLRDTLG